MTDRINDLVKARLPGWAASYLLAKIAAEQVAKEESFEHVGLFIRLSEELAAMYPRHEQDPSPPHVTLFYLGSCGRDDAERFARLAGETLRGSGAIELTLGPVKEFVNAVGDTVRYSPVESGGALEQIHEHLRRELAEVMPGWAPTYPEYKPHVTLEYVPAGTTPEIQSSPQGRWTASAVELWGAGSLVSYGLTDPVWLEPPVPTDGPATAKIAFVGAAPSAIDSARRRPLTGQDGAEFRAQYLEPLGLARGDVVVTNVVPERCGHAAIDVERWHGWVEGQISERAPTVVVALGRFASTHLGGLADFALPHPSVVRRYGDSGEVRRKLRQIKAALLRPDVGELDVRISKADDVKRIVYGVVLDPYGAGGMAPDAHNDWNPPAAIERTAHAFLKGPRVIGIQHERRARATVIESHVEQYPSREDYLAAIANQPHSVWRRKFGDDVVHSGSWVLGVELGADEWQLYLDGEITAFSPGGMGVRTPIRREQMPEVRFVDLVEATATAGNQ